MSDREMTERLNRLVNWTDEDFGDIPRTAILHIVSATAQTLTGQRYRYDRGVLEPDTPTESAVENPSSAP